jgi:Tol biopolymer transport system component
VQTDESFGRPLTPMMFEAWEIFGRYPIFLSNGQIVYNGCDVWENASNCGIFRVDTAGSQPESVTTWPGDIPTDNAGNQILAMSNRSGNWEIYRIDSVSGTAQQLTDNPGTDGLATASPDGSYIAFVSDRDGTWAIYTMRADGSGEQKLFELDGGFGSGDRDWLQERISWGR